MQALLRGFPKKGLSSVLGLKCNECPYASFWHNVDSFPFTAVSATIEFVVCDKMDDDGPSSLLQI